MLPDGYEAQLISEICCPKPTRQQAALLRILMRAQGWISHSEVITKLWPDPYDSPINETGVMKVQLSKLRKKLVPPARIKTIWGRGYVLLGVPGILPPQLPEPVEKWPTASEAVLLRSLMDWRVHSAHSLAMDLYEWHESDGSEGVIKVFLSKLRKKLAPGWEIQNVWGRGWKLVKLEQ